MAKPGPVGRPGGHRHVVPGATPQPGLALLHTVLKDLSSFPKEALPSFCPAIPVLSWQMSHTGRVTEPWKAWVLPLRGRAASLPLGTSRTRDQPSLRGPNSCLAGALMPGSCGLGLEGSLVWLP